MLTIAGFIVTVFNMALSFLLFSYNSGELPNPHA